MFKRGFTLAEVLITLAIIGVVAAISIPSVISNSQQQEFKTGLRKAVSVLNSAITMNIALDGESPLDNGDMYRYLQKHMSVMKSMQMSQWGVKDKNQIGYTSSGNLSFYTTDGMRFEFSGCSYSRLTLHENNKIHLKHIGASNKWYNPQTGEVTIYGINSDCNLGCGSYGLSNNPDGTTVPPCFLTVDVNGDRKPNPDNVNCYSSSCMHENILKFADPEGKKLTDMFTIMITDRQAIPYGVAAQRAMYQAQK